MEKKSTSHLTLLYFKTFKQKVNINMYSTKIYNLNQG